MTRADDDLSATALREMAELLDIEGPPLFTRLHRWDRANAQHEVGHLDTMAAIDQRLAALPGLYVTGSGFRGVGVPDCVADARLTAQRVTEWLGAALL